MKAAVIAFFVTLASASAQNTSGSLPAACGPIDASFNVRLDESQRALAQPEPGKALIYFIYDSGAASDVFPPTEPMMLGIDGVWVGANRGNSYFAVSVSPGEHHMCAASRYYRKAELVVLEHLQAEAGKIYFFRTRFAILRDSKYLELDLVNSDEGHYLIASYPLSISHLKR